MNNIIQKIDHKTAVIGIVGLGYVGLPLALEYATRGFKAIGSNIDERRSQSLTQVKAI